MEHPILLTESMTLYDFKVIYYDRPKYRRSTFRDEEKSEKEELFYRKLVKGDYDYLLPLKGMIRPSPPIVDKDNNVFYITTDISKTMTKKELSILIEFLKLQ
jgi:hypothetical protein